MTKPVVQLDDFGLTELHVHWEPAGKGARDVPTNLNVTYVVHRLTSDPTHYRLALTVKDRRFAPGGDSFANVHATILGFFIFPSSTEPAEREKRIRINGLTMLYGALRGALATVCGVFPPGFRYVLPTVNMLNVIKAVETKRAKGVAAESGSARTQSAPKPLPRVRPSRPRKTA